MNKRIIIQDLISDTGQVGNVTVIGDDTPGPTPTGTISITENGSYDVAQFAEAEVEVEEVQGMVDMAINYTDPNGNAVSVTVRDNEVIGFSTQHSNFTLYIPLRKTFTLQTNDEIRLTLSNVNNCDKYWDIGFACVAARASTTPNINVITNVRIQNGITEYTYNGNPIPVSGIYVIPRSGQPTNGNVKFGLSINGETLF